ncbi:MAG: 16S rRNA (uracil(1498)-N(3))-methyltransferase [Deltaproteobacteria bacterium]|nr:16S rRNA (uracil(1498)-N(3))-methyltransferase [Deltaproteobacteria bacterium]
MTIPRIYFPRMSEDETLVELEGENLKYIKNVLRLKEGDPVILFDGSRYEYSTIIRTYTARNASLEITGKQNIQHPATNITLAQSLAKSTKMDFIVQKATELGVTRLIPFVSSRSIPKLSENKISDRVSRWRKIAVEASRQCKRVSIPEITNIISFDEMLKQADKDDVRIIFWEEESKRGLKTILHDKKWKDANHFFLVVGPEGGFSKEEVERASGNSFISATLGNYILRTETAALTILAIVQYDRGIFSRIEERERAV